LAATVVIPPNAGTAVEMIVQAARSGKLPPEKTYTETRSFPALEELANTKRAR